MQTKTWLVVGASRGIGLELIRQILARGDKVIATVRDVAGGSEIYQLQRSVPPGYCQMLLCDVSTEWQINVSDYHYYHIDFSVNIIGIY
jgi:NAD(P)-dependent dehydrogenase (short-subunit alcohol dehydrogenase family)